MFLACFCKEKEKIWHSTTKHLYTKTLRLSAVCIHSSKISYIPRHPKNPINPSLHLSLRLLQYCFHQDKIITNSKPHSQSGIFVQNNRLCNNRNDGGNKHILLGKMVHVFSLHFLCRTSSNVYKKSYIFKHFLPRLFPPQPKNPTTMKTHIPPTKRLVTHSTIQNENPLIPQHVTKPLFLKKIYEKSTSPINHSERKPPPKTNFSKRATKRCVFSQETLRLKKRLKINLPYSYHYRLKIERLVSTTTTTRQYQ